MKFEATVQYPADLATVTAMLVDPEYLEFRIRKLGVEVLEQSVTGEPGAPRIRVRAVVPQTMIPANYRRFVPAALKLTLIEAWQPKAGDRSPTGTMTVEFDGLPARASASFRLDGTPSGCERHYNGDVTANVPLIGKKLETAAVGALTEVVRAEQAAAAEYLSR